MKCIYLRVACLDGFTCLHTRSNTRVLNSFALVKSKRARCTLLFGHEEPCYCSARFHLLGQCSRQSVSQDVGRAGVTKISKYIFVFCKLKTPAHIRTNNRTNDKPKGLVRRDAVLCPLFDSRLNGNVVFQSIDAPINRCTNQSKASIPRD